MIYTHYTLKDPIIIIYIIICITIYIYNLLRNYIKVRCFGKCVHGCRLVIMTALK